MPSILCVSYTNIRWTETRDWNGNFVPIYLFRAKQGYNRFQSTAPQQPILTSLMLNSKQLQLAIASVLLQSLQLASTCSIGNATSIFYLEVA